MKLRTGISLITLCYILFQNHACYSQDPAVSKTIEMFFDGMRKGDSSLVRKTLATPATLTTILSSAKDSALIRVEDIDGFIKAVGTPHTVVWDERIYNLKVMTDGPMAMAWAPYQFYAGNKFSHCGVNVFTLARSANNWKIVSITDTRRETDCP